MKLIEHLKLALAAGLITGVIIGTVDCIARVVALSFEWFEFYQAFMINIAVLTLGFLIAFIFIEILMKIFQIKIEDSGLAVFYFLSGLAVLLLLYTEIIVKSIFFRYVDQSPIAFYVLGIVLVVYIFILIKNRSFALKVLNWFKGRNFLKKYIYMVIVFVIASFLMDVYLINKIPDTRSGSNLTGPNVMLITLDAFRADHFPTLGYPLNITPNLDRMAKDSVVFENAIAPSSWSVPSHASLFTGKYPFHHNAVKRHQRLDDKETTLAEILRKRGYNTAGFGGGVYLKARYGFSQGFMTYRDRVDFFDDAHAYTRFSIRTLAVLFAPAINKIPGADTELTSEEINKDLFEWLDKNKGEPFFVFVAYEDPHSPYTLGKEFREKFTNNTVDYREIQRVLDRARNGGEVSDEFVDLLNQLYDNEIYYLDRNLGSLFEKMDELEIEDNTILVILADHGEEFYDHGGFGHALTLYEEVIHVPLVIYYPKEFQPRRIEKRIGVINIFPTILEILEIEVPKDIDSKSLVQLMKTGGGFEGEYVFSEILGRLDIPEYRETEQRAVSNNEWKLIEVKQRQYIYPPSLFNLKDDPRELNNLYDIEIEKRKELQREIAEITGEVRTMGFSQGLV